MWWAFGAILKSTDNLPLLYRRQTAAVGGEVRKAADGGEDEQHPDRTVAQRQRKQGLHCRGDRRRRAGHHTGHRRRGADVSPFAPGGVSGIL